MRTLRFLAAHAKLVPILALAFGAACSDAEAPPGKKSDPGTVIPGSFSSEQEQSLEEIQKHVDACNALSSADFLKTHQLSHVAGLAYDPTKAAGLGTVQGSALALDDDELAALGGQGFVITERKVFPTFIYGYATIYSQDLPLYVSADSILHAVHRSYDNILKAIEQGSLVPDLAGLLASMRGALGQGGASSLGAQARADADLYLAVAEALVTGQPAAPVAGASAADVAALVAGAEAAVGTKVVSLFGADRVVDFSQFKPRGHYTESEPLKRYFRAMIWLGRVDLRFLETQPDHTQRFYRRQVEGAFALGALMDAGAKARWQRVHAAIAGFVGKPDSMTVPELDKLLGALGIADPSGLASLSDEEIAKAITEGGYGQQKIAGHIMYNGLGAGTMPLSSSFLLFGQAYVIDSHVFSNVVFDRVQGGSVHRMMPDPLDVSFAALDNDQAASLLAPQIQEYAYAPDLCAMRAVVDAHGSDFWQESLYNLWLASLRSLSPTAAEVAAPTAVGLPSVTGTEAWGRRLLSTQLASWAELRHDTILYAKQSYTGGDTCEFPDAYVDPYPAFYAAIGAYAQHGKAIVASLDFAQPDLAALISGYFDRLGSAANMLQSMAEHQRTGTPFTEEQMSFINQAVVVQEICGGAVADGWYPNLYFGDGLELDPTIADVHTQPTEVGGAEVGRVLHVGTGQPRLMVVTAETCSGPRAYVGLASSYFERVTEDYLRLDDETWSGELVGKGTPDDVPWMKGVVVR